MTNKLVVSINSLKVPKIKKILLYETKFHVPNYSCLQNRPQIPVLSVLCPQLNLLKPFPPEQNSRVRHWLLHWKSNAYYILWVCVCSLRCPACNARAPYFHLWAVPLYRIFPHYLINSTIFRKRKKVTEYETCVLIFSSTSDRNIFHSERNSAGYYPKVRGSSCKVPVIIHRFSWKLEFSQQIFGKKNSNTKFHENPSSGSRVVPWGQTDGQTWRS